ncbi:MAG: WYL domain-containing protein [Burkholderiales bacterium]|nr:MAG: WYL domain-containing protein [Burkholderiales bacterium]
MTLFYILLGALAVWVLYKVFAKPPSPSPQGQPNAIEIPIKITVTHDEGGSTRTPREEIDKDEWEGSFWEVTQPLPAKARLRIKYTDGADRKTERTIDVRQFGAMGPSTLLIGHCHMRNATRTFRTDRIESCVDVETGEVISDVRAYLQQKYDASPDKTKDLLLEGEYDTLRVLLYVGKADGQLRAAEKAVIRETCIAITNDSRLTERTIEDLFVNMDVPTLQAFKLAVGRIAKRDSSSRTVVMTAAEKMVATQKAVHQAEQEALDYMRKRFFTDVQNAA